MVPGHPSHGRLSVVTPIIEHMIETLAAGTGGRGRGPHRLRAACPRSVTARPPRTGPPPSSSRSPPGGPTSTRPSRSTPRPRSPSPGASTRNPSPARAARRVAEFCIAELGAVLGMSTASAKKLIGHALELRHRLPRLWAQVQSGAVRAVAGPDGRRGHHPRHPRAHSRGRRVGGRPGRRRRRSHRPRAARPARRRDHQALRARRCRTRRRSRGRLPVGRPAPRHAQHRRRPLRRHPAPRGRPRPRRRPRPRPGPGPRRGGPEGTRVDRVVGRTPRQGPRRPGPHPDRPRPLLSQGARAAHGQDGEGDGLPAAREVVLHAHFTPRPSARRRCSVPPAGSRKANGWCCSTRSRPGAATPGPRSPSSPSSTSPPPSKHRATRSPTGSASTSFSATAPACSRGAPDPARGCDVDHVIEYDHDADAEGRPQPGPTSDRQPRRAVSVPPPTQDPHRLALPDDRARCLRVDQPPRPPLPTRPHRHHPDRRPPEPPDRP